MGRASHAAFAIIWVTGIFLNIGTAMFDTASAWLMTSLYADPMAVGMAKALTIAGSARPQAGRNRDGASARTDRCSTPAPTSKVLILSAIERTKH
jgi:Transmembrane secretion effector